jgi:hypothetical protein
VTSPSYSALDPDQKTATQIIQAQLEAWGLSSLAGKVTDLIREGLSGDAITLRLQATDEYKTRFAANEARIKAGLAALTPAAYIATENAYRQVMQSYGLPSTFYDSTDDYRKFLELDLSPNELNDRAKIAQQTWLSADTATRDTWRSWYGLSDGAAIASILDPTKALPIVQSMAEAAKAGGAATRNGLEANESRIRGYVDQGISADQLSQGFSQIGAVHETDQAIGRRFGVDLSQQVEEASRIQGTASARRAQAEAYGAEQALFQARPGADGKSLTRRTTGSY